MCIFNQTSILFYKISGLVIQHSDAGLSLIPASGIGNALPEKDGFSYNYLYLLHRKVKRILFYQGS